MKKKLSAILAAALIITGLTGCQGGTVGESSAISDAPVNMEPTDEFVIYRPPYTPDWMSEAIMLFRQMYPDVKVTIEDFSTTGTYEERCKQYQDRVNNELTAGEGPDIIFPIDLSANPYKAMQGNIYLDLTSFFEQDKNFNKEDFVSGVFEAGQYKGRQYIVPLQIAYPQFIARIPVLEQLGIDQVASGDTASFLRQMGEKSQQAKEELNFDRMMEQSRCFGYFLMCANIKLIDYENKQVCPEPEKVREFMEAYKTYYKWDYNDNGTVAHGRRMDTVPPVLPENYCYQSMFNEVIDFYWFGACFKEADGGYCDFFLGDMDGNVNTICKEYAAVPVTSKNQLNAYRFIQLLLSVSIQKKMIPDYEVDTGGGYNCPVNREATEACIRVRMEGPSQITFNYPKRNLRGTVKALSSTDWLEHIEKMKSVSSTSILSDRIAIDMVWDSMEPFFKDEKPYESCFDELKSKLTIYMDE